MLEVTLLNDVHGFMFEEYGESITIRRTIKQSSGGGFALLGHDRKVKGACLPWATAVDLALLLLLVHLIGRLHRRRHAFRATATLGAGFHRVWCFLGEGGCWSFGRRRKSKVCCRVC